MWPRWMSGEEGSKPSLRRSLRPEARAWRSSSSTIISATPRCKRCSVSTLVIDAPESPGLFHDGGEFRAGLLDVQHHLGLEVGARIEAPLLAQPVYYINFEG